MKEPFDSQVATDAKGRGVLRLLLLQQQLSLLSIPALCLQLVGLAFPSEQIPLLICVSYEIFCLVVITHHSISSIAIALGRYVHIETHFKIYTVWHALSREVLFCFLSEVPVINWAAQ